MAHKKGQGSSRNGRDSNSQRLGVKAHDGNLVTGGTIIVRQIGEQPKRFRCVARLFVYEGAYRNRQIEICSPVSRAVGALTVLAA